MHGFPVGVVQAWVWDLSASTESRPTVTLAIILKKETVPQNPVHLVANRVQNYVAAGSAPATRRAYSCDRAQFQKWCLVNALEALPSTPAAVACYVVDQADAGKKVATLERALLAIGRAHQLTSSDDPTAPGVFTRICSIFWRTKHRVSWDQLSPKAAKTAMRNTRPAGRFPAGSRHRIRGKGSVSAAARSSRPASRCRVAFDAHQRRCRQLSHNPENVTTWQNRVKHFRNF